ncbi:MAG TPA: hypothetical protein VHQ87_00190, partial [Rhizobacter sp.]|nr:hypothetical protein [Rhizobacter sp.]
MAVDAVCADATPQADARTEKANTSAGVRPENKETIGMLTEQVVHASFPASAHLMACGTPHTPCWPVSGLADDPCEPSQRREAPV